METNADRESSVIGDLHLVPSFDCSCGGTTSGRQCRGRQGRVEAVQWDRCLANAEVVLETDHR